MIIRSVNGFVSLKTHYRSVILDKNDYTYKCQDDTVMLVNKYQNTHSKQLLTISPSLSLPHSFPLTKIPEIWGY